ncbi:HAMP domain-containing protein, partial [Methylobacterium nigriterrae]|uniref:HAMP domain-containing protein n=1 Tax=Methylobacterium nigriterrae TaxID=3127512 RepID=UPI003013733F
MTLLNNLKILVKLAIPSILLVIVSAGVILLARSSLSDLDANTRQIVDFSAQRAVLVLQLAVAVDEATIREKNLIIESANNSDRQVLRDQHTDAERAAHKAVDGLIELSDTPERVAINKDLKELTSRFFSASQAAVALVLQSDTAAAAKLSNGEGRSARKAVMEAINQRVAANVTALTEAKQRASEVAASATQTLTIVSVLGLLLAFGLLAGTVVLGITRPLGGLVAVLQNMARGEVDAEIRAAVRGDEIGAVGRAVEGIKAMVAQKAAEQAEIRRIADEAAAAERKHAMSDMADGFERAVGGIIGTVTSAATELQATAQQMTSTASETASQSTTVAAAAEEAAS